MIFDGTPCLLAALVGFSTLNHRELLAVGGRAVVAAEFDMTDALAAQSVSASAYGKARSTA